MRSLTLEMHNNDILHQLLTRSTVIMLKCRFMVHRKFGTILIELKVLLTILHLIWYLQMGKVNIRRVKRSSPQMKLKILLILLLNYMLNHLSLLDTSGKLNLVSRDLITQLS